MKKLIVLLAILTLFCAPVWAQDTNFTNVVASGDITVGDDLTVTDDVTVSGDFAVTGAVTGLLNLSAITLGTMTNGTTETTLYLDDTPTGEWAEVDAGTAVTLTADAAIFKIGAKSLKIALTADAVAGDGADGTVTNDDLGSNESIGFWIYSSTALTAGYFYLELDDDDAATDYTMDLPDVAAATWTWVELDASACDGGGNDCNVVSGVKLFISATGVAALGAVDIYLDGMYKWDAADEEALGVAIAEGGVLSVLGVTTAESAANTLAAKALYTDYLVNYQTGSDVLVTITDQSASSGLVLVTYQ